MNIISLSVRIPEVKNNIVNGVSQSFDYSIIINESRIDNYYHSVFVPANTIITNSAKWLINNFDLGNEINVLFHDKKDLQEFNVKTKTVNKGLISNHKIINEVLEKTPIRFSRDSVKDSLMIMSLVKKINNLEPVIPQTLIKLFANIKSGIEVIKPYKGMNIMSLSNGLIFNGPDAVSVKNKTLIKHLGTNNYSFNNDFYSLGAVGKLCSFINELWIH